MSAMDLNVSTVWDRASFSARLLRRRPPFASEKILSAWLAPMIGNQDFDLDSQTLSENDRNKLQEKMGEDFLPQALSLAQETDAEMFWEQFLNLAESLEESGKAEPAFEAYALIQREGTAFPDILGRALVRQKAMLGQGSFGARFEGFTRNILTDSAQNILPMLGGAMVYEVAKAWSLSRLLSARSLPFLSEGFAAGVGSSAFGTMLEIPSFLALSHGLRSLRGEAQAFSSDEFLRVSLNFGAMKFFHWGGGELFGKIVGREAMPGIALEDAFTRFSRAAIPQAAGLLGLWSGIHLEETFGLREPSDPLTRGFDTFTAYLSWNLGGALARDLMGSRWAQWQKDLTLRQKGPNENSGKGPGWFSRFPAMSAFEPATANGAPLLAEEATPSAPILMMASNRNHPDFETPTAVSRASTKDAQVRWSPPLAEVNRAKPMVYSPETEKTFEIFEGQIREGDAALGPAPTQADYLAARADFGPADTLWFAQGKLFADSLGGKSEIHGLDRLLEPIFSEQKIDGTRLWKAAAGFKGSALSVLEMEIPATEIYVGRGDRNSLYTDFNMIMSRMQNALGGKVRLISIDETSGKTILRIPSLSLFQRMLYQSYGPGAAQFHFVMGEIGRDAMMHMRGRGVTPIAFSREALHLGDINVIVPPWFYTFHDLFHSFAASQFEQDFREYAAWLYTFDRLKIRPRSRLVEGHMDRLADLAPPRDFDGDPKTFLDYTMNFLWKNIDQDIQDRTLDHRKFLAYRRFLDNYRKVLAKNPPPRESFQGWHQETIASASRSLKRFDEIILETIKAMKPKSDGGK